MTARPTPAMRTISTDPLDGQTAQKRTPPRGYLALTQIKALANGDR